MPTIESTISFIKRAHAGQTDKNGVPYYLHLLSVAHITKAFVNDEEVYLAALLHDVVEDTEHSAQDLLSMGYSQRTVRMVEAVSRDKSTGLTYMQWITSIAKSEDRGAIIVKLCDNLHNSLPERIAALPKESQGIVKRYSRARAILVDALLTNTNTPE